MTLESESKALVKAFTFNAVELQNNLMKRLWGSFAEQSERHDAAVAARFFGRPEKAPAPQASPSEREKAELAERLYWTPQVSASERLYLAARSWGDPPAPSVDVVPYVSAPAREENLHRSRRQQQAQGRFAVRTPISADYRALDKENLPAPDVPLCVMTAASAFREYSCECSHWRNLKSLYDKEVAEHQRTKRTLDEQFRMFQGLLRRQTRQRLSEGWEALPDEAGMLSIPPLATAPTMPRRALAALPSPSLVGSRIPGMSWLVGGK